MAGALDADDGASMALVTVKMPLPSNFGRIVRSGDAVERIVEVRDATPDELADRRDERRHLRLRRRRVARAVARLRDENAQARILSHRHGRRLRAMPGSACGRCGRADHLDVLGINDRVELAQARKEMNARICAQHMRDGVTIVDPDTTYLEPELTIGRDTVIYPNTTISRLSRDRRTAARSARTAASRQRAARRGRHRPRERRDRLERSATASRSGRSRICAARRRSATASQIGNFVEIKKSEFGARRQGRPPLVTSAMRRSATRRNIGAGTITCNFDGEQKNKTESVATCRSAPIRRSSRRSASATAR